MHRFIDPTYWFSFYGNFSTKPSQIILSLIIIISAIAAVYLELRNRKNKDGFYKKTISSLFGLALTNFIVCGLLLLLSYEEVPLLSSRFWLLFLLILDIIWSIKAYRRWKNINQRKALAEQEELKKKYLPRKNGK